LQTGAGGATTEPGASLTYETAAGTSFFLSGEQVVHSLLNLKGIRDPDRWLKRHKAPVALDTGHEKRFLAADILRWAAEKFAPEESSRRSLLALAEGTVP
jgi:hypothetical protein